LRWDEEPACVSNFTRPCSAAAPLRAPRRADAMASVWRRGSQSIPSHLPSTRMIRAYECALYLLVRVRRARWANEEPPAGRPKGKIDVENLAAAGHCNSRRQGISGLHTAAGWWQRQSTHMLLLGSCAHTRPACLIVIGGCPPLLCLCLASAAQPLPYPFLRPPHCHSPEALNIVLALDRSQ